MFDAIPLFLAQDGQGTPDAGPPNSPTAVDGASPDAPPTQEGSPAPNGGNGTQGDSSSGLGFEPMLLLLLVFVVMMIFMSRGSRKEKKKRAAMLAAVSKGAKIKTVGGILGTVVEVRDNEIIVKVDENANTRLRFDRTAIQTIIEGDDE
jgi:preprotein translocase subunit YajC